MHGDWTDWKPFPDPTKGELLTTPLGPGCYELRLKQSRRLVLFGSAGHVASRMTSLHPQGSGTRKNADKRKFVGEHLNQIEYRTIAAARAGQRLRHTSGRNYGRTAKNISSPPRACTHKSR